MAQCQPVPSAKTQATGYVQRIDRVIDYLRGNLHRPVKLAELANVACFSELACPQSYEPEHGRHLKFSWTKKTRWIGRILN